ncbi:unnamed protein product [Bursaphelenchus okinawaensis]|uniref:Uncharacterized protein n=1 Tax=Bursaphelenchus okinawaensis TaxID=465554 RepID=A0A811KSA0_9BILA|nr:unnamed protein product [Bursaphelenchus okinawaensis]CAG9110085.1 unnamed protein product [Bursaphelenchus okinawaensis]
MEYMSIGFIRTLLNSKLLTDDDRILVEDALTDSAMKFPSNYKFMAILVGLFSICTGTMWWAEQNADLFTYNLMTGITITFVFVVSVGFFPVLLVPLAYYGIRRWEKADHTIHLFLAGLKRRENYIYG